MTEPERHDQANVPNPNALGEWDNPPGQVPLQPVPWSFNILPILQNDQASVIIATFTPTGRQNLFTPCDFALRFAQTLHTVASATMETSPGGLTVPQKQKLIVPGISPNGHG
jgi:hypothetical protein